MTSLRRGRLRTIRVVFFDLGGVCLTNGWDHEERRRAARYFRLGVPELERRHREVAAAWERGEISRQVYLDHVVFYRARRFSRGEVIRWMEGQSRSVPEVLAVLKQLKESGRYRLATINNESLELNRFRIERFRLREHFSDFFSSCFLGVLKPDARIFRIALHVTQCRVRESLFIDDRAQNVAAARALGLHTIHFRNPRQLANALQAYCPMDSPGKTSRRSSTGKGFLCGTG